MWQIKKGTSVLTGHRRVFVPIYIYIMCAKFRGWNYVLEIFLSVSAATPSLCVIEDFRETGDLFYHPAASGINIQRDPNLKKTKKTNRTCVRCTKLKKMSTRWSLQLGLQFSAAFYHNYAEQIPQIPSYIFSLKSKMCGHTVIQKVLCV